MLLLETLNLYNYVGADFHRVIKMDLHHLTHALADHSGGVF
jgi:hypothetical protein